FVVDCPPLPEPVWVDRDLWEKIVLNLLSNAFKFTFEGEIAVSLRPVGPDAELSVRDTGTGIPKEELPQVFERFHRVEGARGRTYEGTGIGLALVQELVKLHGGTVRAESEPGRGSVFTVSIPFGNEHLPADRIDRPRSLASTALGIPPFLEEMERWGPEPAPEAQGAPGGARILLADDNADMRDYVRHLLSGPYEVEAVADGESALAAARLCPPDLVLTDIMMPGLDGFALLKELRADPRTASIPVILLSARAGEESRVEGLEAGADDYLIKPFSARELAARVGTHLEIARLRRQTEEDLRSQNDELSRAKQAAEEANRAKDHFLATLSHELRTPLTPVLATAATLENDPRFAEAKNELAMIRRNVELEARLIDDLLDLTRIARGKLELHREVTDLHRIVRHAFQICCAGEAVSGRLQVRLDLTDGEPRVWADASRLTQVFWNLLNNAVKFTPPGGTVTVRSETGPDGLLTVEVADTGIGIEPEVLPHVFDAFEQGEALITRRFGGLGLGLAISRAIVEMHGGRLTAASGGRDCGATFAVRLPLGLPAGAGAEAPAAAEVPLKVRSLAILLIEDHGDTAEAMADLLRLQGHRVTVAGDVAQGLAAAEAAMGNGGLDLVVSDLGLPDGSGLDLMRELSRRYALPGIALSGYGMEDDMRRSREAGFNRHLIKPVNPSALEAAVRETASPRETASSSK
ncbi:MAG TPA: ATP-binding protein, partial [Thermoanaerobaculia bacterium]|nr:ATP-binding protein [Thermoanaerobaculia bacterium]